MPTLHASPDWAHPSSTTTTRPGPVTVTAVTPAPTASTTSTTAAPTTSTTGTVPADAADVVLQPGPAVSDVVLLPATVAETAPPPPVLPHTGAHTADMATAAVCLIFAGALAILTARRIRRTESDKR